MEYVFKTNYDHQLIFYDTYAEYQVLGIHRGLLSNKELVLRSVRIPYRNVEYVEVTKGLAFQTRVIIQLYNPMLEFNASTINLDFKNPVFLKREMETIQKEINALINS